MASPFAQLPARDPRASWRRSRTIGPTNRARLARACPLVTEGERRRRRIRSAWRATRGAAPRSRISRTSSSGAPATSTWCARGSPTATVSRRGASARPPATTTRFRCARSRASAATSACAARSGSAAITRAASGSGRSARCRAFFCRHERGLAGAMSWSQAAGLGRRDRSRDRRRTSSTRSAAHRRATRAPTSSLAWYARCAARRRRARRSAAALAIVRRVPPTGPDAASGSRSVHVATRPADREAAGPRRRDRRRARAGGVGGRSDARRSRARSPGTRRSMPCRAPPSVFALLARLDGPTPWRTRSPRLADPALDEDARARAPPGRRATRSRRKRRSARDRVGSPDGVADLALDTAVRADPHVPAAITWCCRDHWDYLLPSGGVAMTVRVARGRGAPRRAPDCGSPPRPRSSRRRSIPASSSPTST